MIERVANAIAEAADLDSDTMYADMARAAIEAMRRPTMAMLEPEVMTSNGKNWLVICMEHYPRMIDAALDRPSEINANQA